MYKHKYYLPFIHKGSISAYPFLRIGGFGLGNMLFPFFRAITSGIRDGATVLYPFYNQIQPRNFVRGKNINSLRNYNNVFSKFTWSTLSAYDSMKVFYRNKFERINFYNKSRIVFFEGYKNYFFDLEENRLLIQKFINYSFKKKPKLKKNLVSFHIRLGDFLFTNQSISRDLINDKIQFFSEKNYLNINLYSDYDYPKLLEFLNKKDLPPNIKYIRNASPMLDIIDMSNSEYIVGNPKSTFVEWARFLAPLNQKQISYSLLSQKDYKNNKISPLRWDYFS